MKNFKRINRQVLKEVLGGDTSNCPGRLQYLYSIMDILPVVKHQRKILQDHKKFFQFFMILKIHPAYFWLEQRKAFLLLPC